MNHNTISFETEDASILHIIRYACPIIHVSDKNMRGFLPSCLTPARCDDCTNALSISNQQH